MSSAECFGGQKGRPTYLEVLKHQSSQRLVTRKCSLEGVWYSSKQGPSSINGCKADARGFRGTSHRVSSNTVRVAFLAARESTHRSAHKQRVQHRSVQVVTVVPSAECCGIQKKPIYTLRFVDRFYRYALKQGRLGQDFAKTSENIEIFSKSNRI